MPNQNPEQYARDEIDILLTKAGWVVQDKKKINFSSSLGVAVREYQTDVSLAVYAAWNNILLIGKEPSDEEIVTEARENWHQSKLNIARDKFFTALNWMRKKGIVPSGRGHLVKEKNGQKV